MMKPKRFIDFYSNGDLLYCLDINKFGEVSAFHMYNVDSRKKENVYYKVWKEDTEDVVKIKGLNENVENWLLLSIPNKKYYENS